MSEAARDAEARRAAAGDRLRQLQDRLERLRAGEPVTREDLDQARAAARRQRVEWSRSYQRMLRAHETAVTRRWSAIRAGRAADRELAVSPPRAGEQNQRLLHALMALTSPGSAPTDSVAGELRTEQLWAAVVDRCQERGWRSWSQAVCRVAVAEVRRVRGAAITSYATPVRPQPVAASDEWTRRAEELQQVVGEGPGLDASSGGVPIFLTPGDTGEGRWPGYTAALASGVKAIWSLPLRDSTVNASTLTCYLSDAAAPDPMEWRDGWVLATIATAAIRIDADAIERGDDEDPEGYAEVDIAAGVLAERVGMDPDEAMARMRAQAFADGSDLASVARSVLTDGLRL